MYPIKVHKFPGPFVGNTVGQFLLKCKMEVGRTFASFNELEQHIRQYESVNSVQLAILRSLRIEAIKKRAPKKQFAPNLEYGVWSMDVFIAVILGVVHKGSVLMNRKSRAAGGAVLRNSCATTDFCWKTLAVPLSFIAQ